MMENSGTNMYMPVAPAYNNGGGFFGGDMGGGWWVILLILLLGGGLWGGFGGVGGMNAGMDFLYPWLNNSQHISDGFRDQMLQSSIGDLRNDITAGFGNVQNALCSGFAQAEIANNARQMADMQQNFAAQTATLQGFNGVGTGIADLKYTVAAEECATRANSTQNTNGILNAINGGIQSIKDQLCQDKIDAKNDEIANLRQQIAMKDLAASQVAQNALISQGFTNEVDQLYNRLNNCPVPTTPVYGRTPIFSCGGNGCGCNGNFMN